MPISKSYFTLAKKIVSAITWAKIFKILILAIISILFISAWYFKDTLITNFKSPSNHRVHNISMSFDIKTDIEETIRKENSITAIRVMSANFQRNVITEVYMYTNSNKLRGIFGNTKNNSIIELPLFNNDKDQNSRIVRLINGDFVCTTFAESSIRRIVPEVGDEVSDICTIGIPPYYGEFSGVLVIYLKSHPDKNMYQQMFLISRDLSAKIYNDNRYILDGNQK